MNCQKTQTLFIKFLNGNAVSQSGTHTSSDISLSSLASNLKFDFKKTTVFSTITCIQNSAR